MADVENNGGITGKGWVKGQSGNPGGRPKGIAAKAREHTDKCIEVLVSALSEDDAKTRIAAARELLDRGHGKPLAMTADVTNRLDDLNDADLDAAISAIRDAIKPIEAAGGGETPTVTH